ncbi:hypothetical protein [Rhizobium sp. P44RR-XXIV]|uniref:hypothetical protein n=1 Tax=Rhizobium sp. P44RR-XXIV TaxID=1921145 RepID=UPI0010AB02C7|nr:hypothetical protein [Rhizobium sp. P44RR-XXIV]TIX91127.1 hypothetical protein BSK43_009035 [Rhizobium sp. P44RR-XXIV]
MQHDHPAHIDDEAGSLKSTGTSKKIRIRFQNATEMRSADPIYQHRKGGGNLGTLVEFPRIQAFSNCRIAFVDFPQSMQEGGAELDLQTLDYPALPQGHGLAQSFADNTAGARFYVRPYLDRRQRPGAGAAIL